MKKVRWVALALLLCAGSAAAEKEPAVPISIRLIKEPAEPMEKGKWEEAVLETEKGPETVWLSIRERLDISYADIAEAWVIPSSLEPVLGENETLLPPEPRISIRLLVERWTELRELTERNVGRRYAVVLHGKVVTAKDIFSPVWGGDFVLKGRWTPQEAQEIAARLCPPTSIPVGQDGPTADER
ncbi:MAG: hypothetical protein NC819_02035 [Candidatus Omnitrophica bacterium]|nr:hypothetical protein [Candidatus Omnitrophota bacterium]